MPIRDRTKRTKTRHYLPKHPGGQRCQSRLDITAPITTWLATPEHITLEDYITISPRFSGKV